MDTYVCLLRAVNVGGTGKLPMAELRALCEDAGFAEVRTYIASGNVVLRSRAGAGHVQATMERALEVHAGKPVRVMVRTPPQLAAVLAANPFPDAAPNRTVAIFLDAPPPRGALDSISGQHGEELALGACEIYVHYGDGMAGSKLRIPAAATGTARNLNTVAALVRMTQG
jgi:uncharacterized protein (DUF1697 family)